MLSEYEKKVLDETHERNLKRQRIQALRKDYDLYMSKGYTKYADAIEHEIKKLKEEMV